MPRRRKNEEESLFIEVLDFASQLPWWGVLVLAALSYGFLAFFIPFFLHSLESTSEALPLASGIFGELSHKAAPFFAGFIILAGFVGGIRRWKDGRMLDRQTGMESLRSLSWQKFEGLLAAAFEREGFRVERAGGNGPDGGVDLRLYRDGALVLVQCKHWKTWKVGVQIVRELRGVVASEGANGGIVVTSGAFTADAVAFAKTSGMQLVDGPALLTMIRAAQQAQAAPAPRSREFMGNPHAESPRPPQGDGPAASGAQDLSPMPAQDTLPPCPKCGSAMVRRVARRGPHSGNSFLGCTRYPQCRGTLDLG